MASRDAQYDSFDALLQRMCDERMSEADTAELIRQLHNSSTARRKYMEVVHLSIGLADWSLSAIPKSRTRIDSEPRLSRYLEIAAAGSECRRKTRSHVSTHIARMPNAWLPVGITLAATILIGVTVVVLTAMFDRHPVDVAVSPVSEPAETVPDQQAYVARVVEVTPDADWDIGAMPREFLMRLRPGEQLHLLRGLAKVEYYSGARLILHGPAVFEPTGRAAGHLLQGRVSGRIENRDFLLTTPSAEVVDLGTEFGVSVGPGDGTDVLVFDGEVRVRSDSVNRRVVAESVNLTEGMTVRVSEDGRLTGESMLTIDRFSRRFGELSPPAVEGSELSLVDILCGGSGRGQRLAAAIDPLTGDWDQLGWQKSGSPGTRRGDVEYHASFWHPMIDGAFIPDAHGNPIQVDSTGRKILLPPDHQSFTWGPVWARRFSHDLTISPRTKENDFWGADTFPVITRRLANSRYGGIGIHANVGITFNLNGVRELHAAEIDAFQAVLTNLDNAEAHNPEYARANIRSAHFWVIVDGEMRYEQLDFRRNVGGIAFEVPIAPSDQMLTLITTDAGNDNKYDHVVLIDPVLNLHAESQMFSADSTEAAAE